MDERILSAGRLRLDLKDERLWQDGKPVKLGGRPLALLRCLMEQPGTLVTKDEIFEKVWSNLAVSDSVLTTAAKELRQALGDDARNPKIIETVHRRGYRLLLPTESGTGKTEHHDRASASPSWMQGARGLLVPKSRWQYFGVTLIILAALALWLLPFRDDQAATAGEHPKSIAVLPFQDFSQNGDQGWFANGLADEILNTLSRTPDLQVAARTSTLNIGTDRADLMKAARALDVAHVLDGSVRRDGNRVRVSAVLIDVRNGVEIWSQSYDRNVDNVIGIQEDIAFSIASALKTVTEPAKLRAMMHAGTRSVEAYQAYLQGLAAENRQARDGSTEHFKQASGWFERARKIDPDFAAAHWQAAEYWFGKETRINSSVYEDTVDIDTRFRNYVDRLDAAIQASRGSAEGLKYRATRAAIDLQMREALTMMQNYLAARPRDIDAWEEMADISAYAGDRRAMAQAGRRLFQLSNEAGAPRSRAITVSVLALDLKTAEAQADDQMRRLPGNALTQYQAHRAYIWVGKREKAAAVLQKLQRSKLPEQTRLLAELRQSCSEGRTNDAVRLGARIDQLGDMGARVQAAEILGNLDRKQALLAPLDTPASLRRLVQFAVYPSFDVGRFPVLKRTLQANGVTLPAPVPTPAACKA